MSNELNQSQIKQTKELTPEEQEDMFILTQKLKKFGNSLLEFVGLSTDDFTVSNDDMTGGYSIEYTPVKK